MRPMQVACSPKCALDYAASKREKAQEKQWRQHKAEWKERNASYHDLVKKAQTAFNAYIRERDRDESCICCDKYPVAQHMTGGAWDCGHYRSVGSAPHLRFNEDNAHKQLKNCNRDRSGNVVDYRLGLIKKIGLKRVEALESDNEAAKHTREDLKSIAKYYRAKTRELIKQREQGENCH